MKRAGLAAAIGFAVMALVTLLGPAAAQVAPGTGQAARYTGLHAAAHRGDLAALDRLLAARPDAAVLNARDAHGRTPVHVAAFARQREALRRLARAGADLGALENDRYDAVTIAAVADDEDTLRTLLALGASARLTTSRYDGTALIAAAHLGHDGVVRQLIAAGAPLDHVNNLHWTAVIESIVLGDGGPRHQATLQALLQAGASTRLADAAGRTPLALARSRAYGPMVRLLEAAPAATLGALPTPTAPARIEPHAQAQPAEVAADLAARVAAPLAAPAAAAARQ